MKKRIAILGSTGSIGTQSLEVISENHDRFEVEVLTANDNHGLLIEQARQYLPNFLQPGVDAIFNLRFNPPIATR